MTADHMNLKKLGFMAVLLCLSGCHVLDHLGQLSVLGDYSREKDNQGRLIKSNDANYDALVKAIDLDRIRDYKDEASILHSFGEPILKKGLVDGVQRWLYRYAIYKTAKTKVYVYFDRYGKMIKWEKEPCPSFF